MKRELMRPYNFIVLAIIIIDFAARSGISRRERAWECADESPTKTTTRSFAVLNGSPRHRMKTFNVSYVSEHARARDYAITRSHEINFSTRQSKSHSLYASEIARARETCEKRGGKQMFLLDLPSTINLVDEYFFTIGKE